MELEHEANRPVADVGEAGAVHPRELLAREDDRARGRHVERPDAVEERGLARARLAHQTDDLALEELEIDAAENLQGPPHVLERLVDVLRENQASALHHDSPTMRGRGSFRRPLIRSEARPPAAPSRRRAPGGS